MADQMYYFFSVHGVWAYVHWLWVPPGEFVGSWLMMFLCDAACRLETLALWDLLPHM